MKIIHSIILLLCFSPLCQAQNDWEDTPDTMAIISRAKADAVLKHFDTIQAPKLLYSLDDTYYYLIIKNSPSHKEYYIVLDSLGLIEKLYYIKDEAKTRKQKRLKKQYQGLLSEAEPIFDLNKYHADFITGLSEPNYTSGRYSYFVVIDTDGKRYGEYRLSAVTSPSPINSNLWMYLIRRLSHETAKDTKKAP